MGRLAAAVACVAAALASGRRVSQPGAAAGVSAGPWDSSAQLLPVLPHIKALPAVLVAHEDAAHYHTSQQLAEVLGFRAGADEPAGVQDDEEDADTRMSRQLAELLGLRGGEEELAAPHVGEQASPAMEFGEEAPAATLFGTEEAAAPEVGERKLPTVPLFRLDRTRLAEAHARTSRQMALLLELLRQATEQGAERSSILMEELRPLMERADLPLRVGLFSWAVYDKLRRGLKCGVRRPFLDECEEFFRVIAGVQLQNFEGLKFLLESADHLAADDPEIRQAHAAALKYLADEITRGVYDVAALAESAGRPASDEAVALTLLAARLRQFAEREHAGMLEADEKLINMSGLAAAEAANIDVTDELLPRSVMSKVRVRLLGLVAALGHESAFQKVQEALGHDMAKGPAMSIKDFTRKMGASGVPDLVRKLVHKYTTPKSILRLYLALYTAGPLRDDARWFQIVWGLGLLSRFASGARNPTAKLLGNHGIFAFLQMEAGYRGVQFLDLAHRARAGDKLDHWELLLAAHGFLTPLVFLGDLPSLLG